MSKNNPSLFIANICGKLRRELIIPAITSLTYINYDSPNQT